MMNRGAGLAIVLAALVALSQSPLNSDSFTGSGALSAFAGRARSDATVGAIPSSADAVPFGTSLSA